MSTQRDMMSAPRRQRGMALVQWMVLVLIVGGTATLAIRTVPHYIDFYTMVSVVEALPKNQVHVMSKQKIRDSLQKRFKINNIREFDLNKIVAIERKRGATALTLQYEIREHLFYNVDVVLSFTKRFDYS
jgi:hypothetical protein